MLLAVLIMASVVTASIGLGSLIMSSLRQTRSIDNSTMAYYAAETGSELALFESRRQGILPASFASAVALGNGASWTRIVTSTEKKLYMNIAQDSSVQLDLFDLDNPAVTTGIDRVEIAWTGAGTLRYTAIPWTPGASFSWDQNTVTSNKFGSPADIGLDPSKLYSLRLRAVGATLSDVVITAYAGAVEADMPGRVSINAQGSYGTTQQKMNVSVPRNAPLSGIYDFVIFSECSLVKGGTISCP